MALVDKKIFLQYDVPGPILWHERHILEHYMDEQYAVVTPDRDIYIEDCSMGNADLRGIRHRSVGGGLPVGLRASQVYTLPPFTAAEIAGFKVEAGRQIAAQAAADGGGVGPVNAVGAVGAPVVLPVAGQVAQAVLSAGAGGAATSAVTFEPDTLYWLAAEALEDISYGDPMANVLAAAADGAKAIHLLPSGRSLFVVCCRGRDPSLGKFKGCSGQECAVYGELEHVRAKDGEMVHRLFGE